MFCHEQFSWAHDSEAGHISHVNLQHRAVKSSIAFLLQAQVLRVA